MKKVSLLFLLVSSLLLPAFQAQMDQSDSTTCHKPGFHNFVIKRIVPWQMAAHKSRFLVRACRFRGFCLLFFLVFSAVLLAQTPSIPAYKEAGQPLIRNYTAKVYRAAPQTSAVLQDSRGMIYVANNSAVLIEFDGVKWRHIQLPAGTTARSLAVDSTGRIYIGGSKDLGYLAADSKGQLQFQSLLEEVKPEDREFINAYDTYATPGIYFLRGNGSFAGIMIP